jgi:hypothetical protein
MLDGFDGEVHVEIRPVEMVRARKLYIHELSNRRVPKPRELLEWEEEFSLADEKPKAVLRDVADLNL